MVNEYVGRLCDADIAIFSVKEFDRIDVKSELDGDSETLVKMGAVSKRIRGVTVFSSMTDTYGLYRSSAIAFSAGKLLFIADETRCRDRRFSPSYGLKTLAVGGARAGILVGGDCCEHDLIAAHLIMGCDAIIDLSADIFDFDNEKLFSSLAYVFAVPFVSVGYAKKTICSFVGEVLYSGADPFFKTVVPLGKNYKQIYSKSRR